MSSATPCVPRAASVVAGLTELGNPRHPGDRQPASLTPATTPPGIHHPGGMPAMSQGLSGATPPGSNRKPNSTPAGGRSLTRKADQGTEQWSPLTNPFGKMIKRHPPD